MYYLPKLHSVVYAQGLESRDPFEAVEGFQESTMAHFPCSEEVNGCTAPSYCGTVQATVTCVSHVTATESPVPCLPVPILLKEVVFDAIHQAIKAGNHGRLLDRELD